MGELSLASSTPAEARARHERALAVATATAIASPLEEARALEGIGRCHLQHGQDAAPLRRALAIYHRIGSPGAERVETTLRDHGLWADDHDSAERWAREHVAEAVVHDHDHGPTGERSERPVALPAAPSAMT
jgi:hypothetical protein